MKKKMIFDCNVQIGDCYYDKYQMRGLLDIWTSSITSMERIIIENAEYFDGGAHLHIETFGDSLKHIPLIMSLDEVSDITNMVNVLSSSTKRFIESTITHLESGDTDREIQHIKSIESAMKATFDDLDVEY